jgi:hypothetical protein
MAAYDWKMTRYVQQERIQRPSLAPVRLVFEMDETGDIMDETGDIARLHVRLKRLCR